MLEIEMGYIASDRQWHACAMNKASSQETQSAIAIVGGTGKLGAALAGRLASSGYPVVIGSRDAAKARETAALLARTKHCKIEGDSNVGAASRGDIVILAVPYQARAALIEKIRDSVQGKIVVDTSVPLRPPKVMHVQLPESGSAGIECQRLLGEGVRVVAAFHNVAAHRLATDDEIDCDILVFGDDKFARTAVGALVRACGLRAVHGGALANSAAAEALTSVLIFINKTYQVDGAGVRITGDMQAVHG